MPQSNGFTDINELLRSEGSTVPEPKPSNKGFTDIGDLLSYEQSKVPLKVEPKKEEKAPVPRERYYGPFGIPLERTAKADEWGGMSPIKQPTTIGPAPKPKPNVSFGKAETIGPAPKSFIQRALEFIGVPSDSINRVSEEGKALAVVKLRARESGMTDQEYMVSPKLFQDNDIAIKAFVDSFTAGVAPAVTTTKESRIEPGSLGGYAAYAGGSLLGLITGLPFRGAKFALKPLAKLIPREATQMANVSTRIIKQAIREGLNLGLGMGIAETGEALQQQTFSQAADKYYQAAKSGAITGAIFGTSKGLFPAEVAERGRRLITGLIGLNAYRAYQTGGNPFTNRPGEEVIFDTIMDGYFLWKGLPPAEFKNTVEDVNNLNKKVDEFLVKKAAVEQIPEDALRKAATIKLDAEKKTLDDEIDKLSKKVYSSVDAQERGTKRLEKLQRVKQQAAEGKLTTAEEIVAAKKNRKKVVEAKKVEPEKPVEQIKKEIVKKEKTIKPYIGPSLKSPVTGDPVIDFRIKSGGPVISASEISTLSKASREVVETPEGKKIQPGKYKAGTETVVIENYIIEGLNPETGKWVTVDGERTLADAEQAVKRWKRGLKDERKKNISIVEKPLEPITTVDQLLEKEDKFKINKTEEPVEQPSQIEVDIQKINEIEKAFGRDIDQISNKDIENYFLTKEVTRLPDIPEEPSREVSDEEIMKFYGKDKFEDLTDEEIDKYFEMREGKVEEPITEPIKDVDTQTGTPEVREVSGGEQSIFRSDKETTDGQAIAFSQSKSVAGSFDELINQDMINAAKGPDTTVWKLVNDVNRWMNGEEVDIENVRNFLSDIASNAQRFERYFGSKGELNEWAELASDAAGWARNAQRPATKAKGGPSLYSGLDPFEAGKIVGNWYSMLRKVAREKLPNFAPAEQIKNTLRKLVTQDEWNTSQLDSFLVTGRKFSRDEVMQQIDRMMPEFKDVVLEDRPVEIPPRRVEAPEDYIAYQQDTRNAAEQRPKFSSYVEPGGSNYKELFVTAPGVSKPKSGYSIINRYGEEVPPSPFKTLEDAQSEIASYTNSALRDELKIREVEYTERWQDGHSDYSDIENPIVRLRMNDRFITKPVPSDWKAVEVAPLDDTVLRKNTEYWRWQSPDGKLHGEATIGEAPKVVESKILFLEELQPPTPGEFKKMPPEFQKRWREIGMKRAIKYAIDNGYDRVAWTTGEMQASRYNLPTAVRKLNYTKNGNGTYNLFDGETYGQRFNIDSVEPDKLNDYVGDDVAKRILNGEGRHEVVDNKYDYGFALTGIELKNTNTGLIRLYNIDLPNVAKKLGGKVESTNLKIIDIYKYEVAQQGTGKWGVLKKNGEWEGKFFDTEKEALDYRDRLDEQESVSSSVPSISLTPFLPRAKEGFAMYMGFDPSMFKRVFGAKQKLEEGKGSGDEIVDKAKGFSEYGKRARAMKDFKPLEAIKKAREEFNRAIVDKSGNIRSLLLKHLGNEGYAILQKAVLSRGASTVSTRTLQQMRKEVYSGLSRNEKQVLDNLILAVRMTDIGAYKKNFHFPKGIDPVSSKIYTSLFRYIEGLSAEQAKKLIEFDEAGNLVGGRVKAYFDWMKRPLGDMLKSGLITQQEHDDLASHKYRKIELVHIFDKEHPDIKVRGRSVYDSGVESLSLGKKTDIYEPSSEIMALEVFNRSYGRILNNEANLALLGLARRNPDNPFVRVRVDKSTKIPSDWKRFYVYENGQRITLRMAPEIAGEWISNSTETSYRMSQLVRYASGAPLLRTFATGINWGFALANLPRDMMHVWFAARTFDEGKWKPVYNSNLPVFLTQYAKDVAVVAKDVFLRKGEANDLLMEGGGFEFLTHQGRLLQRGRHLESGVDKFFDVMGYLGETSELLGRTALRHRVIKNRAAERGLTFEEAYKDPKIRQEATFAARDYMDFGQGGWASKTLDQVIPYLNASIQGTRGLWRSFKPGSGTAMISTYKLAQFGALVAGLTIAKHNMTPETMQNLQGNRDEENNLVIPYGDSYSFIDSKGQRVYPYHKIPLDPGQKFFKTFFEAATNKMMQVLDPKNKDKYPVDVDRVVESLKQFSPVGDISGMLPPTVSAFIGYVTNKDFWRNEDIWKQSETFPIGTVDEKTGKWVGSSQERTVNTPETFKDIGDITRLSPERLKFLIEEMITSGTEFSWLLGQGYEAVFGGMDKVDRERTFTEAISKVPGFKRVIGLTNPYSQFASGMDEAMTQAELSRVIQNNGFDPLVEDYLHGKGKTTRYDIEMNARQYGEKKIYDRLMDDFKFQERTKNLNNRSFWLSLKRLPIEKRAEEFAKRLDSSNADESAELMREYTTVRRAGGVIGEGFMGEVVKARMRKLNLK